jgi:hypothetical protein
MDLTDNYKVFPPATAQYTFFLATYRTFSKIEHVLGHKACLSKYNNVEIFPCILSEHNEIQLKLNSKRNYIKYPNTWRLNNALLHDSGSLKK